MSLISILVAVLGIGFLMIVHEGGHYLAARASGMRVERFSIGFGPTIFKIKPKDSDTTFQVALLPFLAYVQIAGMNPFEEDVDKDDPSLYSNQGVLPRIVTVAAGPFANYLAAVLMIFGLVYFVGPSGVKVDSLTEDSVAEGLLQPGDLFLAVEDHPIRNFQDIIVATSERGEMPTRYQIVRDGERLEYTITPRTDGDRALIGVQLGLSRLPPLEFGEAMVTAVKRPWELTVLQIQGLKETAQKRETENLVGPVGIGQMMATSFELGADYFIELLALISVALGLMNLLPFPALDGGRLCFLAYEAITRRKASERVETMIHYVGILFLLGLMVLVFYRDIMRLFA